MHVLRRSKNVNVAVLLVPLAVVALAVLTLFAQSFGKECKMSFGDYEGPRYATKSTIATTCLVESKWMRLMQHSVKLGGKAVNDWLFIDYHDRINVLVEDPGPHNDGHRYFFVFRQEKYAYEGESYAIVGGIIEPGEDAKEAAKREVFEEMGLNCDKYIPLGRYRTDVNRGMGWVNSFLATECQTSKETAIAAIGNEVGAADSERQDKISLALVELREAARNGNFVEVQWSNTVSQALLHPVLKYD